MIESNEINNTIYDAVSNALENKTNNCNTLLPSTTGKSTYDLAVDYGYVGTERDWLSSIANDTTVVSNLYADAQSFSDFMSKPSAVSVPRRLAPSIHTLNYYLDYFNGLESLYSQESGMVTVNGVEIKTVRQVMSDAIDDVLLGEYQEGMRADLNAQKLDTDAIANSVLNNKSLTSYNRDYHISPHRQKESSVTTVFAGGGDTHRHFGGIARSPDGTIHLVHRLASKHETEAEGAIVYTRLYAEGAMPATPEVALSPSVTGTDKRDCSIFCTPKGTLVVHFCALDSDNTGQASLRYMLSYDNGDTWTEERVYDTTPFSFTRSYGQVALVPSKAGGYRLVKPSYKQPTSSSYTTALYYSDDDGETWVEGTPIKPSTDSGAHNETAVLFFNADVGIAVTRAAGLNYSYTTNGGNTWSTFNQPSWATDNNYVAPSLNMVTVDGVQYALLGYCNRRSDSINWRWVALPDLDNTGEAFGNTLKSTSEGVMVRSSGYQNNVVYPTGTMLSVEYAEFDLPNASSDVRLVYHSPAKWIRDAQQTTSLAWIPTVRGSTSGSPTHVVQKGRSIKIGTLVTAWFHIVLGAKDTLSGQVIIGGLPYTVRNESVNRAAISVGFVNKLDITGYQEITGYTIDNTNDIQLFKRGATTSTFINDADIGTGFTLYGSVTYEASS